MGPRDGLWLDRSADDEAMTSPQRRGLFITFEGGEGAGKSTQIDYAYLHLRSRGRDPRLTREPGGTAFGQVLRGMILHPDREHTLSPRTESLLFAADRSHHVQSAVAPVIAAGADVLCDRHGDSSEALQSAGGQITREEVRALSLYATAGLVPDLTVILDIDPQVALARAEVSEFGRPDRFEAEQMAFHQHVRAVLLDIAAREPDRCVVIDAARDPEVIAADVAVALDAAIDAHTPDWGARWDATRA